MLNACTNYWIARRIVREACCLAMTMPVAAIGCNRTEPAPSGKPIQTEPAGPTAPVTPTPEADTTSAPPVPKADSPSPGTDLEAVKAAWRKAGARVGWMDEHKIDPPFFVERKDPKPGEMLAFYFDRLKDRLFDTLPKPLVPFGLSTGRPPSRGFGDLAGLKHLRVLHIDLLFGGGNPPEATRPIEESLEALAGLPELRVLALSNTTMSAQAKEKLAALTKIESLYIGISAAVSDKDLKYIGRLGQLRRLSVQFAGGTPRITDAGAKELSRLGRLEILVLREWNPNTVTLTDAGVGELAKLQELRQLSIPLRAITDAGAKHLGGLGRLGSLDLSDSQVTDAGLKELAGLKKLQTLTLTRTKVTDAGVTELQMLLPELKINR